MQVIPFTVHAGGIARAAFKTETQNNLFSLSINDFFRVRRKFFENFFSALKSEPLDRFF
jgi:hypothetical protein